MPDQPTPGQWQADLAALTDAIGAVEREAASISAAMAAIDSRMKEVGAHWSSPSYATFDQVTSWFHRAQHDLEGLLADIVSRMTTSYRNYHQAESANYANLGDGQRSA